MLSPTRNHAPRSVGVVPSLTRNDVGAVGERHAAAHLAAAGYQIVERNFRTAAGELDLIAIDGACLVFCEVRTRVAGRHGGPAGPLASIGPDKRRRLRAMARRWLAARSGAPRIRTHQLRFDAVGVVVDRAGTLLSLEHVEDAF